MKTKQVTRKVYPSDISREQYITISDLLENHKKHTRPRSVDLYEVFCGVLYVLKSGCQWRMIPSDFPKWKTIYQYYRQWSEPSVGSESSLLEAVLKKISWRGPYQTWAEREDQFLYR